VQRWSDLLVCEHLALECAAALPGVASARSRVIAGQGRTFLEVERFDRHGEHGRSALVSLGTADAALLGDGSSDWPRLAHRLHGLDLLGADDVQRIEHLWWFGRLIANTDMHTGNLSFRPQGPPAVLSLAPTYDMLPMIYAPLAGGEVPARHFEPPLPLPTQRATWVNACSAALAFWLRAATDKRIGESFRRLCSASGQRLEQVAQRV
jgi:HipA-like C-terminal domain